MTRPPSRHHFGIAEMEPFEGDLANIGEPTFARGGGVSYLSTTTESGDLLNGFGR